MGKHPSAVVEVDRCLDVLLVPTTATDPFKGHDPAVEALGRRLW